MNLVIKELVIDFIFDMSYSFIGDYLIIKEKQKKLEENKSKLEEKNDLNISIENKSFSKSFIEFNRYSTQRPVLFKVSIDHNFHYNYFGFKKR